jgi:hypothetical protein
MVTEQRDNGDEKSAPRSDEVAQNRDASERQKNCNLKLIREEVK